MSILTLDLGTSTGYASTLNGSNELISGFYAFKPPKDSHAGLRLAMFRKALDELRLKFQPTKIYYEHSYFGAKGRIAGEVRNYFVGVLYMWAHHYKIDVVPVSTQVLRASYGNKFKREESKLFAIKCAKVYSGKAITSNDEADAVMLFRYVSQLPRSLF